MDFVLKKSHKFLAIVVLVVYFLYLVISNIPAKYAASIIHSAAPNVWLNSVTGTVWRGVAHQSQIDINRKPVALGRLDWKVKLLPLLTLNACVDFSAVTTGQSFEGTACKSLSGKVSLTDTDFNFPVSIVGNSLGAPPSGQLSGRIEKVGVVFEKNNPVFKELNAKTSWQNARIYVDDVWYGLGSLAVELSEQNGGVQLNAFSLSGPYGIEATGQWSPKGPLKAEGTVTPKANANQQVVSVLQAIATSEPEPGKYYLKWP